MKGYRWPFSASTPTRNTGAASTTPEVRLCITLSITFFVLKTIDLVVGESCTIYFTFYLYIAIYLLFGAAAISCIVGVIRGTRSLRCVALCLSLCCLPIAFHYWKLDVNIGRRVAFAFQSRGLSELIQRIKIQRDLLPERPNDDTYRKFQLLEIGGEFVRAENGEISGVVTSHNLICYIHVDSGLIFGDYQCGYLYVSEFDDRLLAESLCISSSELTSLAPNWYWFERK